MAGNAYYLVSALPSLVDLGAPPPLSLAAMRDHVAPARGATALVDAILLSDDLLQRDAALSGETDEAAPAVLSAAQVRDEAPLPPFLVAETAEPAQRLATDAVWGAYFRHAAEVAARLGSAFLRAWVAHEVGLRNALTLARAKALELDAAEYLVTPDLGSAEDFGPLVNDWAAAPNPLEGLRALDRGRWQWLLDHDAWFSFADDELAAYAAKLMLLVRWHRLAAAAERDDAPPRRPPAAP